MTTTDSIPMQAKNKLELIYVDACNLQLLEGNPRQLKDPEGVKKLKTLIKEHGFSNPLQIWKGRANDKYTILCGNHRFMAGKELGMTSFPCLVYEGNKARALARAISDNKSSQWTEFKLPDLPNILLEIDTGDFSLPDLTGFSDIELQDLLGGDDKGGLTDPDAVPEAPKDPKTKTGDLWLLGEHHLLCGDSTKAEDVERLMGNKKADMVLTDPPYGVDYSGKNEFLNTYDKGNRIQTDIKNDLNIKDYRTWFASWLSLMSLSNYNTLYIFMASPELHNLRLALGDAGCKWGDYLVWLKNNHVLGRKDYNLKHEFILYGWKGKHKFYGGFNTTILEYNRPSRSKLHPTMKPVELLCKLLFDGSGGAAITYDPFLGSGSTLIACEKTGRVCYGMEIDPIYVQVALERWRDFTGKQPILESTGQTYDQLITESTP